jgi:hypothetical protein
VSHGGTIAVVVNGDCVNGTFTIVAKGKPIGTVATDANGFGTATIALPCRVGPGTQTIVATDESGNTGSASLPVTSGPCASAPGHAKTSGSADTSTDAGDLAAATSTDLASAAPDGATDPAADPGTSSSDVPSAG